MSTKSEVQIPIFCSCAEEEADVEPDTEQPDRQERESGPNKHCLGFSSMYTKCGVQIIIFSSWAEEEASVQPATVQPDRQ